VNTRNSHIDALRRAAIPCLLVLHFALAYGLKNSPLEVLPGWRPWSPAMYRNPPMPPSAGAFGKATLTALPAENLPALKSEPGQESAGPQPVSGRISALPCHSHYNVGTACGSNGGDRR
jgi:hypothetical protein